MQGKYRQIDVILFDDDAQEIKRILDSFRINPYKLVTVRRDRDRDRDSDRNSENQLRIDSKLGSSVPLEKRNSLTLLDAVKQLGNLE
mgnify:CR=1 FL=1